MTTKTCAKCGKRGPVAEDETDAGWDEMAYDTRGLVARNGYVCGECLERAEDEGRGLFSLTTGSSAPTPPAAA